MIRRAFILNDRTAADIMTPLEDMVTIQSTSTIRQAADLVLCHELSRYPVVGESLDEITGVSMSRDILQALAKEPELKSIASLCRTCPIVPANIKSDELLARFRDEHIHLAIVQDQRRTVGLVTLEDVLEELVGEIEDEKDAAALAVGAADSSPYDLKAQ